MKRYFYCKECPLADECSPRNFKSWHCWGWTEEECQARRVAVEALRTEEAMKKQEEQQEALQE